MAAYKPSDAVTYAKTFVKSMPLDSTANNFTYQMCDYISSTIWMAAPFRWTIGYYGTATVTGAAGTDYAISSPPSDCLYLEFAYLADGNQVNDLDCSALIGADSTSIGVPSSVSIISAGNIRINPKPPTSYSKALYLHYKKQRTQITSSNYGTAGALIMDDEWYWVYQAGILWQAYQYADDARAGQAQVNEKGEITYSGQLGCFRAGIETMRQSEKAIWSYPGLKKERG